MEKAKLKTKLLALVFMLALLICAMFCLTGCSKDDKVAELHNKVTQLQNQLTVTQTELNEAKQQLDEVNNQNQEAQTKLDEAESLLEKVKNILKNELIVEDVKVCFAEMMTKLSQPLTNSTTPVVRATSSVGLEYEGNFQPLGEEVALPDASVLAWSIYADWINNILNNTSEPLEWVTVYQDAENQGGEQIQVIMDIDFQEKYVLGCIKVINGAETDFYEVVVNLTNDFTDWENMIVKASNNVTNSIAIFENGTQDDLVLNAYTLLTLTTGGDFESFICYDFDTNYYMISDEATSATAKTFLTNKFAAELSAIRTDVLIAFVGNPVAYQLDFNVEEE